MLAEDITTVQMALGTLAHSVDPETWAVLRLCRETLASAAERAAGLEAQVVAVSAIETAWDAARGLA